MAKSANSVVDRMNRVHEELRRGPFGGQPRRVEQHEVRQEKLRDKPFGYDYK